MSRTKQHKKSNTIDLKKLGLILLLAILFFLIIAKLIKDASRDSKEELKRTKASLETERERLKNLIKDKEAELEAALNKYKVYYRIFRIAVVIIWALTLTIIHVLFLKLCSIGEIIDLNSALLLLIIALNYLLYGEIFDFKEFNGQIKERITNICFKGNLSLKDDIFQYNKELDAVESRLEAVERELEKI